MALLREQVMAALRTVQDPELFKDIVSLNIVKDVRLDGDNVYVRVELTNPASPLKETIKRDVEAALRRAGAQHVTIDLSGGGRGAAPAAPKREVLPQVKNIIAVGAGKGGVGKSTLALNLAVGLRRTGAAVGLMDGDIYGPSMPTLLGIKGAAPALHGNKILPFHVHGIYAVTIGALVEQDKPLIWRGPMAHGAFKQLLLENTEWPELDYLIVDLPPGTGDVPLTLCQLLPLTGAVVVATPQQVALDDAVRAIKMFQQLGAPILGMVENMSYFVGPDGTEHDIFGRGGTERAAQQLGLAYLGALPMFTEVRVNSDAGRPEKNFEGDPKLRAALESIVTNLAGEVSKRNMQPAGPSLTIQ
ncbi:MAG: Iron-sulfur cluster carrier protein [Phycisphaerales bacterium]|nr:Iron-sulfur cluster carrier protein [Phycisphaerales bacterium]MDB5354381.1 Iron-sulfur cluster carrier protein [Phycisphaerales bacterium]